MGGKKKGDKKKDGAGEEGGPLTDAQQAQLNDAINKSLQWQLAERTQEANHSIAEKRNLYNEVQRLQMKFKEEQNATFDITKCMTRQYKGMQEQLKDQLSKCCQDIQFLKDELEESNMKLLETEKAKDQIIKKKNREIEHLKQKMEDMAQEFGEMLKETLDKMRERIEVSSTHNFESDLGDLPIEKRMEEFNIASNVSREEKI